ncbi:MAG: efflux RND transporter periplasmic adaptor subunit, partial [Bacteroidota bacterium]
MKKVVIVAAIFILVAGVGYYFWNGNEKPEPAPIGQVQRVAKVTRGDLSLNVSANGVVQPINKVDIKSKASGIVIKMDFEEGQYVVKGTGLLELDTTTTKNDYDQAKADLELAQSSLAQKENDFHRSVELFSKNLISQQERDQSEVTYISAKSQLVKAKAALSSAEDRLRDTKISAPINGVILSRSVEIGQIIASGVSNVGGGTLIATIADMGQVHVETNVDEVDIGKVQVGQNARVIADAYPDDAFYGTVERIAPLGKTQQNVTTFNVIILVKNLNEKLKAGMSASVDIEVFNRKNVLLVPNEALKDPRSDQGRVMMTAANLTIPEETVAKPVGDKSA